ncbi:MAG TPA: V-type ATP synthase subunit K [Candidatus Egerieicola faecale]|uniref:V-type ATP synthase subunit K n=1 Tax=Candidatus Egerieicola faecale TaxID=2840774 RepID=A0A9D1ITU1_9FIRM|nr:V-type ATP synthase subunit K [Candidatus Egerieicola faecale]
MTGLAIAIFGAALCAALAGCGSAIGVMAAGKAAAGVTSQKPELFGKLLVLQALPGTQGIYGFLTAILIMVRLGLLGGSPLDISDTVGWQFFFAALPMGLCGLISGIAQGKTAVAAIHLTGKQPDAAGKGITMTALVETYAILALLISILLVFGVTL